MRMKRTSTSCLQFDIISRRSQPHSLTHTHKMKAELSWRQLSTSKQKPEDISDTENKNKKKKNHISNHSSMHTKVHKYQERTNCPSEESWTALHWIPFSLSIQKDTSQTKRASRRKRPSQPRWCKNGPVESKDVCEAKKSSSGTGRDRVEVESKTEDEDEEVDVE